MTLHSFADWALHKTCRIWDRHPKLGRPLYRAALRLYHTTEKKAPARAEAQGRGLQTVQFSDEPST